MLFPPYDDLYPMWQTLNPTLILPCPAGREGGGILPGLGPALYASVFLPVCIYTHSLLALGDPLFPPVTTPIILLALCGSEQTFYCGPHPMPALCLCETLLTVPAPTPSYHVCMPRTALPTTSLMGACPGMCPSPQCPEEEEHFMACPTTMFPFLTLSPLFTCLAFPLAHAPFYLWCLAFP